MMVLHITTILLSMSLQIVLKNMVILIVWVKTLKNISHLVFLSKRILKIKKSMIYRLKFIDNFRFMATSLSNFINNVSDQL